MKTNLNILCVTQYSNKQLNDVSKKYDGILIVNDNESDLANKELSLDLYDDEQYVFFR